MKPEELHWFDLDRYYTLSRRTLSKDNAWRFGPDRVYEVAKEAFQIFSDYKNLNGNIYCDLGCGTFHPYGVATIMYLNGAGLTISLDAEPSDLERAAEALYDLLSDCIAFPEKWNWSGVSNDDFINKIRGFDLRALKNADINNGIKNLPLHYLVSDINSVNFEYNSIDLMSSRAVLEHFLEFESAIKSLYSMMSPGGVAYHSIDLVDHRAYESKDYHYWSFLSEGENWSDGVCNRLRSPEIKEVILASGFELMSYEEVRGSIPTDFIPHISSHFLEKMSMEDLSITCVKCILKKPFS